MPIDVPMPLHPSDLFSSVDGKASLLTSESSVTVPITPSRPGIDINLQGPRSDGWVGSGKEIEMTPSLYTSCCMSSHASYELFYEYLASP